MSGTDNLRKEASLLRDILLRVIRELDDHHKNKNIATAVGSGASLLGGVLTIAGAILAIPTAGLTVPVAGAGAVLAGAGSVVCLGASVVETIIAKNNLSDVQKRWDKFLRDFALHCVDTAEEAQTNILGIVGSIISGSTELAVGFDMILDSVQAVKIVRAGQVGARLASGAAKVARVGDAGGLAKVTYLGTKAVGTGFFVLNAVMIPINLVDLVRSAAAAVSDEPSEASAKLRRMAAFLDRVAWAEDLSMLRLR